MSTYQLRVPGGASEEKQDVTIEVLNETLTELIEKLEPGQSIVVSNAQTDALTDDELRASDVNVADSGEREYTHVVATVNNIGDTTIHTPAAGKAIRLHWIYAINNPVSETAPLIKVKLGALELFRVWAISKRQRKTGAIDAPLVINLSSTGSVAITALLEEIP